MASSVIKNWAKETTTTTGTGTVTLGGAVTGFATFANAGVANLDTVYYAIYEIDANGNPSGAYEVGVGVYTSSGTTLSRVTILASSNSNAAVSFAAGTKHVIVTAPAEILTPDVSRADGRLTASSGNPVPSSDVATTTNVYYSPYIGNKVSLFNGTCWQTYTFAEVTLALGTLTSGKNYDVFLYNNAGTLTMEFSAAWTNDTTRADALTTQDGILVKSGSLTRRYVGTIRTISTTQTCDIGGMVTTQVGAKRFVWSYNNQVLRSMGVFDSTNTWAYTTQTIRQANGAAGNQCEWVVGVAATPVRFTVRHCVGLQSNVTFAASSGVGLDATNAYTGLVQSAFIGTLTADEPFMFGPINGDYQGFPGLGYHFAAWCEYGSDGTCIFLGDNGGGFPIQTGMLGQLTG